MAISITSGVLLLAGLVGLVAVIWRHKTKAKEVDTEAAKAPQSADKPNWFMADDKDGKKKWWRISLTTAPPTPLEGASQQSEGGRIERLKAALNRKAAKNGKTLLPMFKSPQPSPRDTMKLPFQAIPEEPLVFPDPLEPGYRAPIYVPQQPAPQVPSLTRTMYDGDGKVEPRSPPKAIITQGLSRTFARHDKRAHPRSPATRRKSWLTRGGQPRHPFIPLNDADVPAAKTAAADGSFQQAFSKRVVPESPVESPIESPPSPPSPPKKRVPAPLNLTKLSEYKNGFGLPSSPRHGLPASPRPRRGQSPAI
jgi:hypothetical protein